MIQQNLKFFSILAYFLKSQSMILVKKNLPFKENYKVSVTWTFQ